MFWTSHDQTDQLLHTCIDQLRQHVSNLSAYTLQRTGLQVTQGRLGPEYPTILKGQYRI
jgi:hypothetical protein